MITGAAGALGAGIAETLGAMGAKLTLASGSAEPLALPESGEFRSLPARAFVTKRKRRSKLGFLLLYRFSGNVTR